MAIRPQFSTSPYEPDSQLSTNFLLIAPTIIVLDRLRTDFDGLKVFQNDPLLPDIVRKTGNIVIC